MLERVVTKLSRISQLSKDDAYNVLAWNGAAETIHARNIITKENQTADKCAILVNGIACRSKMLASGERQILSFHLPGDMLDLQHFLFSTADHYIEAVTACRIWWVPYQQIRDTIGQSPALMEALWRDTLLDASIFREWILNVGRRNAKTRVAHLLCELRERMVVAGVSFEGLPDYILTQEYLADATGLTAVHVNRMIGELRERGALPPRGEAVTSEHVALLRAIADFRPNYLHQLAS
ncbi:Crp/Fnr family transcriptional regulator [Sphingomonas sp. TZW2008]|uniref:Crp/Fnr family transcriptional regulator n=1 Tax=Sphingomonas sp. TZW2008 TaxID=1917973 RepID=UPI000A26DE2F|nr:Crp/Fnr family transcriptional regulator [Sphingomonas sp. TZW2008]